MYEGLTLFAGQASPVLEGIAEEGSDAIPELMVVPPPPPRKPLPHPESLGPAPEKPSRPPSLSLTTSRPSTPEDSGEVITLKRTQKMCEFQPL